MRPRRGTHTAWRQIGDDTVVLDLRGKRMFGLNASAGAIWHALDNVESIDALADVFGDLDRSAIEAFVDQLGEHGLLAEGPVAVQDDLPFSEPVAPLVDLTPPAIIWSEAIPKVAATCAFLPGESDLCNQVPTS
ncbi:MAG: PqqD family protein [Acidobacteriota bacterium]